jgi:hypothetical protein
MELHANLTRKTHEAIGAAWCAAEARKLNDPYFPGVSARVPSCALAPCSHAPPSALRYPSFVSVDPAALLARRRVISPKSEKSRLGRIPLRPWAEETTESTAEGRVRHSFETEWFAHW